MASDITMHVLEERFIPLETLAKEWKLRDKRYPEAALQKFMQLNSAPMRFLAIDSRIDYREGKAGLLLISSNYVGCIPLRSPSNGKKYADLRCEMRYGDNIGELISLLGDSIEIEYAHWDLNRPSQFRPPFYLLSLQAFEAYRDAMANPWHKFRDVKETRDTPEGDTDWTEYSIMSADPTNRMRFANRLSIQAADHREWRSLQALISDALNKFNSSSVPPNIRARYQRTLDYIGRSLPKHNSEKIPRTYRHNSLDPPKIKRLKEACNELLDASRMNQHSWRTDMATVFERYVQHIFGAVARRVRLKMTPNPRFPIRYTSHVSWGLRYLEPDLLLTGNDVFIAIDAKYKSHMLNTRSSDIRQLKETFRSDLHQIVAYTAFGAGEDRRGIIVYPGTNYRDIKLELRQPFQNNMVTVDLISIPMAVGAIPDIIGGILHDFEGMVI